VTFCVTFGDSALRSADNIPSNIQVLTLAFPLVRRLQMRFRRDWRIAATPPPLVGGCECKNQNSNSYMAIKLKPLGSRVLVEPVAEQEVKRGGIIIPDSAKEKPTEAIVRAVGPGDFDETGKRIPLEVKEGDRVLISKYGGTEVKIEDKEYKVLSKDDILAVVE
jgi:chaperonin GroES